jgi:transcriptional regulator with XRE-family HTH domain
MGAISIGDVRDRIRSCRIARGWSLADFQTQACGEITSVAMGSYERGERTLSIPKLMKICEVLGISPLHLLAPIDDLKPSHVTTRHIYDLHALQTLKPGAERDQLLTYIHHIVRERGDWLGAVISLRTSDVENLTRLFAVSHEIDESYLGWLEQQKITLNKALER